MTTESQFTDAELEAAVITDDELRERSQKLDEAQERWETLIHLATEKVACPECGGNGSVGSYICPGCQGARLIPSPDSDGPGFEIPPFAQLRGAITAYGNAKADRELPEGHLGKRGLALPPASSVPTLDALTDLETQAKTKSRELKQLTGGAQRGTDPRQLPEAIHVEDDKDLGDISDAELAEMEDAASMPKDGPRRRK